MPQEPGGGMTDLHALFFYTCIILSVNGAIETSKRLLEDLCIVKTATKHYSPNTTVSDILLSRHHIICTDGGEKIYHIIGKIKNYSTPLSSL